MVVGGANSNAYATRSTAIGTNVMISSSAENAVAVSAYTSKSCATTKPGSLTLCADKNVTIEGSALVVNGNVTIEGSALVVNGVDVLMTTSNLKAELLNTKAELADLKAKVAALTALKTQTQTSPASGSLVGTLLALSLTAAAVA
jgi:hypothetical protein